MKQIFIRAGLTPFETLSTEEVMCKNLIGNNVGNLVYAYGVFRTLMVSEDTKFIPNRYKAWLDQADWINENCEYFIIPLADMFRDNGVKHMEDMTKLVKKLKIPCVIAGVGVRAPLNYDLSKGFPFDDTVKNFIDAVLEKSAIVGVRGEITGKYLTHLGYKEDKDYMVIGCPSMYGQGGQLKRKELKLTDNLKVSINSSVLSTSNTLNFLNNVLEQVPNSYFLPQRIDELWTLYMGVPYKHGQNKPMYPTRISDKIYQENRVKYFLHAKDWIDFLKTMDLSVGGRMHGNIAAIQAGTPCVLIPHDSRMKELTDYHKIPHIMGQDVKENWSLYDLIEHVDFDSMYKQHKENFERFISFLDQNGIKHIYKDAETVEEAPLDRAVEKIHLPGEVQSAALLSREELALRWKKIFDSEILDKKEELKEKKKEVKTLKADLKECNRKKEMLDKSSIKNDARCLAAKVKDKMKGQHRTNYERMMDVKK